MKHRLIGSWFLSVVFLILPGVIFADSALEFDASGQPSKLVLGGKDMLGSGPASGFELVSEKGKSMPLDKITRSGDKITISPADGKPSFIFQIVPFENHLAIHMLEARGIGTGRHYGLRLRLNARDAEAYTLDDRMTANSGSRRRKNLELNWPSLWAWPSAKGTRGSVVLFDGTLSGSERDAVLAEIWSVQGTAGHMVRPAGQETWTEADVIAWVKRWVKKFDTMVSVSIAPKNFEELEEMTDRYVIPSGANRVYMFSTVWRGEYKINKQTNESVNTKVFPKGKADLVAYSDYLAKHGAHLQLKSLVPQLGLHDKRYFSPTHVEDRLLSWGSGTLAEDIGEEDTTILFKLGPDHVWKQESGFIRIGHEMVKVDEITGTDGEVWTLKECQRGWVGSTPKPHKAGTEMLGAVTSYGFFHFADDYGQADSLAEEVLDAYGDFLNDVNAGHLHFDGTGYKEECPWYLRNYTDYVYSRVDQPVTGSRVGGSIKANFEKMFSIAERATKATGYWGIRIGPRLHGMGSGSEKEKRNFAPNLMDMHFDVSDRILLGGRRPNLTAGRSGGILNMAIFENYGLMDEAFALFKDWIELAPVFDDADVEYVRSKLTKRKGSNHYEGEDVLVLGKDPEDGYIYTPHRIMGRTSGEDLLIHIDQEWGAVPRFQKIKAGTTMELLNPYKNQEPQVVIFVEENSTTLENPVVSINGSATLKVDGKVEPGEYMTFDGGDRVQVHDKNWSKLRTLRAHTRSFTVNEGANTITTAASGSERTEIKVQYITRGPVYVLETNKHLSRPDGGSLHPVE